MLFRRAVRAEQRGRLRRVPARWGPAAAGECRSVTRRCLTPARGAGILMAMNMEVTELDRATILRPADELDLLGYQALAEKIDEFVSSGAPGPWKIVLDLGAVTYINSPAVKVLLAAASKAQAAGGALVLAQVHGGAKIVLEASGTLKTLPVYATAEDAVRA